MFAFSELERFERADVLLELSCVVLSIAQSFLQSLRPRDIRCLDHRVLRFQLLDRLLHLRSHGCFLSPTCLQQLVLCGESCIRFGQQLLRQIAR